MSAIRIVVSDADGTLLSRGKLLYPTDFGKAVAECAARNIPIAVASGRTLRALRKIFAKWADRLLFFAFDGAYISIGNQRLADFPIGIEALEAAKNLLSEGHAGIEFCTAERSYLMSESSMLCESEKRRLGDEYADFGDFDGSAVYKLIVFARQGGEIEIPGLHAVYRGERVIEFVRERVDKASAAALICKELRIDPADLMAFGDSDNDRTLLKFAGQPVTIYGAKHEIFALSDKHTKNAAEYVRLKLKQLE